MAYAKTVIDYAKELVEEHGKEKAIEILQNERNELPKFTNSFYIACKAAGYETAIKYINGEIK